FAAMAAPLLVSLAPSASTLSVQVKRPAGRAPDQERVLILPLDTGRLSVGLRDPQGRFTARLPAGPYLVKLPRRASARAARAVWLVPGRSHSPTLELREGEDSGGPLTAASTFGTRLGSIAFPLIRAATALEITPDL